MTLKVHSTAFPRPPASHHARHSNYPSEKAQPVAPPSSWMREAHDQLGHGPGDDLSLCVFCRDKVR